MPAGRERGIENEAMESGGGEQEKGLPFAPIFSRIEFEFENDENSRAR
jgi:hypothetical protein